MLLRSYCRHNLLRQVIINDYCLVRDNTTVNNNKNLSSTSSFRFCQIENHAQIPIKLFLEIPRRMVLERDMIRYFSTTMITSKPDELHNFRSIR